MSVSDVRSHACWPWEEEEEEEGVAVGARSLLPSALSNIAEVCWTRGGGVPGTAALGSTWAGLAVSARDRGREEEEAEEEEEATLP
jgi:hypothetical protein